MIILAFLAAAQIVPAGISDAADAANEAYVGCLFAVSRSADGAGLTVTDFERKLAVSCLAEGRASIRIDAKIRALRGEREPARKADAWDSETRRSFVDDYRGLPAKKRIMQQLEQICRADPAQCRL